MKNRGRRGSHAARSAFALCALGILACALTFAPCARAACPIVVDPAGGGAQTTIQGAVNAFVAGGNLGPCTIQVRAGLYTESVEIIGANAASTSAAQTLELRADVG